MTDDLEKAELRKKIAKIQTEMSEFNQRVANFEKAQAALIKFYKRGPHSKKKSGRPSFWKSYDGLSFVLQVEEILKERKCKIATAIRRAKTITIEQGRRSKACGYKDPIIGRAARLAKLSDEQLQVRYQEARKFWFFILNLEAHEREREALERNFEQALAALQEGAARPPSNPFAPRNPFTQIVDHSEQPTARHLILVPSRPSR